MKDGWKSRERKRERERERSARIDSTNIARIIRSSKKRVDHRSLGLPTTRKSACKGKIVSLLAVRGDIKRSRGHETISAVHHAAIKTVISGRIGVDVTLVISAPRDFA
jgi:hypothetical protein